MTYETVKIDKSFYTTGKSFSDTLERLDPSEAYKGTELEGLDAFERQLKRFDIKVSGPNSDMVSKFFKTSDSAALFPEFISRVIAQGMVSGAEADSIIATTTTVDGMEYRSIDVSSFDNLKLRETGEGATFSESVISVKDNLTQLEKFASSIVSSYEAIKFQRIDVFSIALRRLGENFARQEFELAIDCIGDDVEILESDNTELQYSDLVKLWSALSPYKLTTIIVNNTNAQAILNMPEFRDSNAGLDFHSTGKLITPLGAELIVDDSIGSDVIVGLDKNYAIEKVQNSGGIITEFDKIIDRQLERAAVSTRVGFAPLFKNAIKAVKVSD